MNAHVLTIFIPTYNRNDKLQLTISVLEPQLNDKVKIRIIDNCSPIPVADTLVKKASSPIEIIRNRQNIGASANVIKCIELCDTEWLWVLGDDDPPMSDAVASILADLVTYKEYAFINYKSGLAYMRHADFEATGLEDVINSIDHFGNFLFISIGIYNLSKLKGNLTLTYQLSYCLAPSLLYIFTGIQPETKVKFLKREIIDSSLRNTSAEETWSWLTLGLSLPILYELPLNIKQQTREKLGKFILTHIKSPKGVFEILEQPLYYNLPTYEKRFLMRQIYFRSLMVKGINVSMLRYIWYDLKLIVKNYFVKRNTYISDERYKRI